MYLKHLGAMLASALPCVMSGFAQQTPVDSQKGEVSEEGKFTPKREKPLAGAKDGLGVEPLGGGKFKLGALTFDQIQRTVTIPARMNMREGAVEYALVTEGGKKHEAIFTTTVRPEHIHLACLLLGIEAKPGEVSQEKVPANRAIRIEVVWETNGPEKRIALEQCVAFAEGAPDGLTGKTLASGPWLYSGSRMDAAGFVASREGSLVSLIRDGNALINNPRESNNNDEMHVAHTAVLPNLGVPVRIVLMLPPQKKD